MGRRTARQEEALAAWKLTPTYKEVALALDVSPAAAWALLQRARAGNKRPSRPMDRASLVRLLRADGLHLHLTGWVPRHQARWVIAASYTHVCDTERCYREVVEKEKEHGLR